MFKRLRNKDFSNAALISPGNSLELQIVMKTHEGKKKRRILIGNRVDRRAMFDTASFHEFENEFGLKNGYVVIVGRRNTEEVQQYPLP